MGPPISFNSTQWWWSAIHIAKQNRNAVHVINDHADFAVVEDVAKGGAAADADDCKPGSLDCGNQLKLAILQVVVEQRALGIAGSPLRMLVHFRIDMAIDNQQILPPVIVIIKETIGETHKRDG